MTWLTSDNILTMNLGSHSAPYCGVGGEWAVTSGAASKSGRAIIISSLALKISSIFGSMGCK